MRFCIVTHLVLVGEVGQQEGEVAPQPRRPHRVVQQELDQRLQGLSFRKVSGHGAGGTAVSGLQHTRHCWWTTPGKRLLPLAMLHAV